MDSLLLWLFASPKWQLPFFLDPRSLRNSAPNPNSSKIPLDFPWIRRVGMEGGQEFGIYSQRESVTPVPLDKGFSMIFHGKKPHLGCAGWGKRLRDTWNSLALEYGVENGDGIPTGSINSLPAPEFHPEISKKPQPIPNYPVAGMGWNFLPKFPGISPPNRESGAQSSIL